MTPELEDLCKQLHIAGIFQWIQEQGELNPDIISVLTKSCQFELNIRMMNRQLRTIKQAGFPTQKRFEELLVEGLPDEGRSVLPDLKTLDFIHETENVVLIGNSGTGKTHMAIATGIHACEHNYRVIFKTAAGLVNELLEAKRGGRLTVVMRQLKKIDLLILDELGYISATRSYKRNCLRKPPYPFRVFLFWRALLVTVWCEAQKTMWKDRSPTESIC